MTSTELDKAQGCIVGAAIGDSLGTTYEFMTGDDAKHQVKENFKLNGFLPIVGRGPFDLIPGQITDDTELGLGLARSLIKTDGHFSRETVAKTYIRWFHSHPFDVGHTTSQALGHDAKGYSSAVHNSKLHNTQSLSNGSLMRIWPLGVWGSSMSKKKLEKYIIQEVVITHPNPVAIDAARVYVFAIHDAMIHKNKQTIYKNSLEHAETDEIMQILTDAASTPFPVLTYKRQKMRFSNDTRFQGYLGVALQNMFYEFLHTDSFYQSLVNIISRGGDTDTNSTIAGAFYGAYYGLSGIPRQWVKTVIDCHNPRVKQYPEANTNDILEVAYKLLG